MEVYMEKRLVGRTIYGGAFALILLGMLMFSVVPAVMAQSTHTITFVNNCSETIWPGEGGPYATGWEMAPKTTVVKTVPVGATSVTYWGRTGCTFDGSGKCPTQGVDCCTSGGCISASDNTYFGLVCSSGGQSPVALFEPTFDAANPPYGPTDFFDVSLLDGFSHVAVQVAPDPGTYNTDPDPGQNPAFWCKPAGYSTMPTCPAELWDATLNACWGPCKYYTMKLGQTTPSNNRSALCCDATNVSSVPNIPTSWCNPGDPNHYQIVGGFKCSPYDWADGYTVNTLGCAKGDRFNGSPQNIVPCSNGYWGDLVDTAWPNVATQSLEFIKNVNAGAPGAYAWQFDDLKSSYICRKTNGVVNYTVTFCPSAGPTTYSLQVSKSGTGSGAVTSSPAGINCGGTCTATYNTGTPVTLTATPAEGSTFTGWSGGGCSGAGTCTVTMSGNVSVTAGFTAAQVCTYTIGPKARNVAFRGGAGNVNITAKGATTCPAPTVDVMEGDAWITYSNLTFKKNRGSVKVTVLQNTSSIARAGSVYIGGAILPVAQTGKPCSYTVNPATSPLIAKAGGSDSFAITMTPSDCGWTAASAADWVTVTSGASGTGSGTVFYTVSANAGKPARNGRINVAAGKVKRVHTVRQANK
jgi:hypothetical protein